MSLSRNSIFESTIKTTASKNDFLRTNCNISYSKNESNLPQNLIRQALQCRVESIDHSVCDAGDEDTFFVADLGEIYRQHIRWKINLPRVRPFYAVKCNPDPQVICLLEKLGTGFDCASKAEIEQILNIGVDPTRIIYAQPCKTNSYVRYAASRGIKQMTFDNTDELYKIKKLYPEAELFLRISTDDSSSLCRLSLKFGAAIDSTEQLLDLARELDLSITGISFHIGSGASDPLSFRKAVLDASIVLNQATARGFNLRTLDIGGGFTSENFELMAATLNKALDDYIPFHINVIGEPGRYYVSSAFTLACHVIARRTVEDFVTKKKSYMLYLNDGIYGNFSSILFDHQVPKARVLRTSNITYFDDKAAEQSVDGIEYSIWGPTCDGIDRISERACFDHIIDVGDWLYFENMGAYTKCSATRFNGFTNSHDTIYVISEPKAKALLGKDSLNE
ncbi:putative ornithine decarboxylase [Erysiphe necator]|uniref:Ornithine decarboxylase n=1 Tax=Uncinula necator TaxID=52586 RepID=A0A0B1NXA9_UNCNE|nr:putative ornithine decarboxylase [Erysiphe necator]